MGQPRLTRSEPSRDELAELCSSLEGFWEWPSYEILYLLVYVGSQEGAV